VTVGPDKLRVRYQEKDQPTLTTPPPLVAPQDDSLHYLVAVMRGQLAPKGDLTALDTNIIVMQILSAARNSARTGRTIQLKPLPE
jgi:glucose-fructose oxidoreductase